MDWLQRIYNAIISFKDWVFNVFSYIFDILTTLWFWLTSLLSQIYDIVVEIFNSPLF